MFVFMTLIYVLFQMVCPLLKILLKILFDLNKEIIFIVALEKMDSLVSETQIRYFWENYSKWALQSYTKDLQPGFPYFVRTSCPNFKKLRRLSKKTVTDVCFHVPYMLYFKWNVPFPKCSKSTS